MTSWTERAEAYFLERGQYPTAKTDETPISSVSSVPPRGLSENTHGVSPVSSVGVVALFETRMLAEELMKAAMAACDHHGDGDQARADMRADIQDTPAHLRAD
ncbi:MAG TPA: hypothetical protein VMS38_08580, partial [Pseudorhodoferax sp.]|nr:hypothetical protein [Pseudorhodoferax sp.]